MSLVFTNRSKAGRIVFGLVGAFVYLGGLVSFLLVVLPSAARGICYHPLWLDHDPRADYHLARQHSRSAPVE